MAEQSDNKRIAKNTLLLYLRMLVSLVVSLYTSRVVLNTLGVTDYGINNVVAGVIALLGFITGSLGGATSRFLTFDLGRDDQEQLKKTFGSIMAIYMLLAGFIVLFGETVGLWLVLNKLVIPHDRMFAALWIYQLSIASSVIGVISAPYNSVIIAHEKMGAFAYMSIFDVVMKLLIVYLLVIAPFDKLIFYNVLYFIVGIIDRVIYGVYCSRRFPEVHAKIKLNWKEAKPIFTFAAWVMNGNLAVIGYTQGLNILLNLFFGPAVNAARGIAVQVQSVLSGFTANFQTAVNPQLTKSYAKGDLQRMHELIVLSSKFSFFLLLFLSLPVIFEANLVLKWWLGQVPDHSVNFFRLIVCTSLLYTLANPITTSVNATGILKKFQLVEGSMLLMIVPIAYICLKFFHIRPEGVFVVHICVEICTQIARLVIVLPMINFPMKDYLSSIIRPVFIVLLLAPILPLLTYFSMDQNVGSFFVVCSVCVLTTACVILKFGCNEPERTFVYTKVKALLHFHHE